MLRLNDELNKIEVLQGEMPRQPLNNMLRDFSYRTVVAILDNLDGKVLFKGTVMKYHQSELKNKNLDIELAEVMHGDFVIKVVQY